MKIKDQIYKSIDDGDLTLFKELYPIFKTEYCPKGISIKASEKLGEINSFIIWIQLVLPVMNLINHASNKLELDIELFIHNEENIDYDNFFEIDYKEIYDKDKNLFSDLTDHMIYMNKKTQCFDILNFLLINNLNKLFIEKMKLINIHFKKFKIDSYQIMESIIPQSEKNIKKIFYLIENHIDDDYIHNLLISQLDNSNEFGFMEYINTVINLKGSSFIDSYKLSEAIVNRSEYEDIDLLLSNYFSICNDDFVMDCLNRFELNKELESQLLTRML